MRSRWLRKSFLSCASGLGLAGSLSASAAVTLTVVEPYSIVNTDGNSLYLASTALGANTGVDPSFGQWSPGPYNSNYVFTFTVSGMSTTEKPNLMVLAKTTGGNYVPVPVYGGASTSPAGVALGNGFHGVLFGATEGNVLINVSELCNFTSPYTGGSSVIDGCSGGSIAPNDSIALVFLPVATVSTATPSDTTTDSYTLNLKVTTDAPTTNCSASPLFFPGDRCIMLDSGLITGAVNTGSSSSLKTILVVATEGPVNAGPGSAPAVDLTNLGNNAFVARVNYGSGEQRAGDGLFKNSIQNDSVSESYFYNVGYSVVDSSGLYSTASTCGDTDAYASDIQGFLKESNCFVATASFRDPRAPAVMLLRQFRDEVLSRFSLGRAFIDFYYDRGPLAANWLIENPEFRVPALAALIPVQVLAWILTHFPLYIAGVFVILAFSLAFSSGRRRALRKRPIVASLTLALAIGILPSLALAQESNQPYIDSLLSTMDQEDFGLQRTTENPDPYIQSLKKKLPAEDATGYTEQLREQLDPEESSAGYAEKVQKSLKPQGSAIQDFRDGRKLRVDKGDDKTRGVIGLNFGAAMNSTYLAGTAEDRPYELVYGDKVVPEFKVSYEFRPWLTGLASKVGIWSSLGFSFVSGKGRFAFEDPNGRFGQESKTRLRFITLPLQLGPMIRLPIGKLLSPFFGGGPAMIGFYESRNDSAENMRGYSFGYWATAGLSIGLDWISQKSSWEAYEANQVKSTYLSIGYQTLGTFGGGLVDMTTDGVLAGFTFTL